ncbi:OLC1v1037176C1 [Oldenlandia corymbosa var. corymbosa]|uniref:OLC1v1037176C1 n=1 Tax=Oldenlandia corymbosa var. corymbosa TaxID=529605 RepID=A0AAV1CX52_OLDCO|nr:OLC1v1037176C1 [Oldenlandia corymbosa var. corymbosa]
MYLVPRNFFHRIHSKKVSFYNIFFKTHVDSSSVNSFGFQQRNPGFVSNPFRMSVSSYATSPIRRRRLRGPPTRSLRRRMSRRAKAAAEPVLDEAQFQRAISKLLPRFTPEELCNVITSEDDPLVCLELFNWASQQHRFRHNVSSFHITIKKLGAARMYEEMDDIVNQVLAIRSLGTEALYNTMIYYFTQARKLTRAVNIYKHMKDMGKLDCRPSITTYNILFTALLSTGKNSYINYMYMDTIRCLFRQMVDDGVEPDVYTLNCLIKGYVLSLHVNDALRVFHQMGVVYSCRPNSFSYDYLIHGLCAQGRTNNARELCVEMKEKGFIPSVKSYNSIVNSLALGGELDQAVNYLWEMIENQRSVDFITYRTLLNEICRQKQVEDAVDLLEKLQEKHLLGEATYRDLLHGIEWCEKQMVFILSCGKAKPTKAMKVGAARHTELEEEVAKKVPIQVTSAEDKWALRFINFIVGANQLLFEGLTRELPL